MPKDPEKSLENGPLELHIGRVFGHPGWIWLPCCFSFRTRLKQSAQFDNIPVAVMIINCSTQKLMVKNRRQTAASMCWWDCPVFIYPNLDGLKDRWYVNPNVSLDSIEAPIEKHRAGSTRQTPRKRPAASLQSLD